jgi:hypothetical protein
VLTPKIISSRAAKYMTIGGYIGSIGGVSSLLAIQQVCNGDSGAVCEKVRFTEGGKFGGSTFVDAVGGRIGQLASGPICLALGVSTGIGGCCLCRGRNRDWRMGGYDCRWYGWRRNRGNIVRENFAMIMEEFWKSWLAFWLLAGPILLGFVSTAYSLYLSHRHLDAMMGALKNSRYISLWGPSLRNRRDGNDAKGINPYW